MNLDFSKIFNLKSNNLLPEKGMVLISEPFAVDDIFKRSVVLLTEYSKEGAMGFILNKPVAQKDISPELIEKFSPRKISLCIGGPVELDRLFYIYYSDEVKLDNSIEVTDNIFIGGDFGQFVEYINKGLINWDNVRLFVGYSGWAPGQLDDEIKRNFWIVKTIKKEEIFSIDKNMWENQVKQLENSYKIWTMIPEDPRVN